MEEKWNETDKGQVSGRPVYVSVTFFYILALLTSFLAGVTKQDSYFPVLFGIALCMPLIWLYRTIMVLFPDENFIQILKRVWGPVAGTIIGAAYVWFFITLTGLNLTDLGNFVKITVMTETPHTVLAVMCMLTAVWAVRYGIRVVTRYSALFTFVEFFIVAVTIILVVNQIKFENLLPVFDLPPIKYIQATHIIATIPFGELVVFLMIIPNVKLSNRDATKYWFLGVGMGMLTLLVVLLRDIAILGNTLHLFALPGLVTLRLVNMGEALSRMKFYLRRLVMLLYLSDLFLLYIGNCHRTAHEFKYNRHLSCRWGLRLCLWAHPHSNPVDHTASAQETVPFICTCLKF
jgi:spore germination protein KB